MINKSECSKKFKKICDRTVATTKEEIRSANMYSKLWSSYSTIKDAVSENTKKLNSLNLVLEKKRQRVEALKQLDRERQDELEQVRRDIKTLQKEIASIRNNESQESEKEKQKQKQLLQMMLLKECTRTYIDDKRFPHVIRGFSANEQQSKVVPFELDIANMTEVGVKTALWEKCYRSSGYANEWNHLFCAEND